MSYNVFAGGMADDIVYTLEKQPSTSIVSQRCQEPETEDREMHVQKTGASQSTTITKRWKKNLKGLWTLTENIGSLETKEVKTGQDITKGSSNLRLKPGFARSRLNSPLGVHNLKSDEEHRKRPGIIARRENGRKVEYLKLLVAVPDSVWP